MSARHRTASWWPRPLRRARVLACLATAVLSVPFGGATAAWAHSNYAGRHRAPHAPGVPAPLSAATMPAPSPPAPAPEDTCVPGAWTSAQGAPPYYVAGDNAAYLWHDADGGWALRVTHAGARAKAVFSGALTATTGQFVYANAAPGTGNDIVYLSANRRTVYFRFVNFGLLDGLDFATHCTRGIVVHLRLGPVNLPAGHIFVGASGAHPPADPFRVTRSPRLAGLARRPVA